LSDPFSEPPSIESISRDIRAIRNATREAADQLAAINRLIQGAISAIVGASVVFALKYHGWI
jgi:hypothetical protein